LQLRNKPKIEYPLYSRSLQWDQENSLGALPTINHQFRSEEDRPPVVISLIFALGPIAVLGFLDLGFSSFYYFLLFYLFFVCIVISLSFMCLNKYFVIWMILFENMN